MNKSRENLWLFLKGMAMGGADVVPGVSGGTIAFITGIYEELLNSIKSFDTIAIRFLAKFKIKEFWKHINGNFLVVLLSGIIFSIATLARIISYLLEYYPIQLWSFFFGLIIISAFVVAREITKWTPDVVVAGFFGIGVALYITLATPAQTPTDLWFIFLSGAIAICAMILPGISGSFILLIMGKYEYIISALRNMDLAIILVFIAGCIIGLLSFAKLISWLLKNYHNLIIAILAGFMIGSLNKIWPWKLVTTYRLDRHGIPVPLTDRNVWPAEFLRETYQDPVVVQALFFMLFGIALVFVLDRFANTKTTSLVK
jgi:putative membrane protein